MNFIRNIFLILFFLLSIYSCKKDAPVIPVVTDTQNFVCGRDKFIDTIFTGLNSQVSFSSSISGKNNLYVSTIASNSANIIKMDCDANLIWQKSFTFVNEKVISVSCENIGDHFYILTATDNFTSTPIDTEIAYVSNFSINQPSGIDCNQGKYSGQLNNNFVRETVIALSNSSHLYKYNSNGVLLWQKNLTGNYFSGNGICLDNYDNIYILTARKKGYDYFKVDSLSTSYPFYAAPLDSNSFTLSKFDSTGNPGPSLTLNSIKSRSTNAFNPSLSVSLNNIAVKTDQYCYFFDMQTSFITKKSPISDYCIGKYYTNLSNPALNNQILYGKSFSPNITSIEFYINGNKTNSIANLPDVQASAVDINNDFYFIGIFYSKCNSTGNLQFTKALPVMTNPLVSVLCKQNRSYFFIFDNLNGRLFTIKPDYYGNY